MLIQERRESHGALPGELRRDPRVAQPSRAEAVVAVEDAEVVVRIVEDLFDLRVGEEIPQGGEIVHRERVDDRGLSGARELHQDNAVAGPGAPPSGPGRASRPGGRPPELGARRGPGPPPAGAETGAGALNSCPAGPRPTGCSCPPAARARAIASSPPSTRARSGLAPC